MQHLSRGIALGGALVVALMTAACSADRAAEPGQASSTSEQVVAETGGGTESSSAAPVPVGPTEVVTDAPISVGPAQDAGIFLTFAGWEDDSGAVTVRGYLQGVVEDDGICTLTLTNGERSVTATKSGTSNVTDTSCGNVSIAGSKLSPGSWKAVLSYASSTSSGSSEPVDVDVP